MPSILAMSLLCIATQVPAADLALGPFEGLGDVGTVLHKGSAVFDSSAGTLSVTGAGENMWFGQDACHFVWKRIEGDAEIAADIAFVGKGKNPHRKACLMIRSSLDADSAYVDVAIHGDGLTSLQFRESKGANTHEVQANLASPTRAKLVRRGKYATLFLSAKGEEPRYSGCAARVLFDGPAYIGLAVCSHEKDVAETAIFSNLHLGTPVPTDATPTLYSTLETQSLASTDRRVVLTTPTRIEAPNWLPDGKSLLYNAGGRLYRVPAIGGTPTVVDTGFALRCNNDHGVAPDGSMLVISDQSQSDRKSRIYTLPIAGGTPTLVTSNAPSYWHGWSPDGKTLVYCAEREGDYDVYSIGVAGGPETRLTTAKGLDDGPEYSPDGKTIYFNSERTGSMRIWRMNADGSDQQPVTDDSYNNWFAHPSPDGRTLVFLSYEKDVTGHPENKDVLLRRFNLENKRIDVLARVFGGQGTINVPCFSPDGGRIAFVTYQLIP